MVFENTKLTFFRTQETHQIRQPFYNRELDDCEMRNIRWLWDDHLEEKNNHKRKCNSRVCCDLTENFVVYMTHELKSDMIVKYDHGCEVQVVKMNSKTWLLFIPFSFVISTRIQNFLVIFCRWGGLHYGCICKIIKIAWGYKCVNHDMCKIKIKLKKKILKERI